MSIAKTALRWPHTFLVLAVLILIFGIVSIVSMPTDVFPVIDLPVITVIWSYNGVTPDDMSKRFVYQSERSYTTAVDDIQHIESQSVAGVGVVRIYLQPGANVTQAIAQVTATSQNVLRLLPPGTVPPLIVRYDASDVPVVQAAISSPTLTEAQLFDYAQNFVRTQLVTVRGTQIPQPYGGRSRVINVDINPNLLLAQGLSPYDVTDALTAQNLVLPSGDIKIGERDYTVTLNSTAATIATLNRLPIKESNGAVVTIGDVAQVRDGYQVQTNIVHIDGRRAVLLKILKHGAASTLDVVSGVRSILPRVEATLPASLKLDLIADQSVFVRASVQSVVREALVAACLTAALILLFLGNWRSTLIVAVSIPLSILASIVCLDACGETLNTTTLGGLALAVGILVDNATVTIENIDRNLGMGKSLRQAILDGCAEIAGPTFVSTGAICIVFVPMAFLTGVPKYLFLPMAESVIFAILASYVLAQTLTPVMTKYLMAAEVGDIENDYAEEGEFGHAIDHSGNGSHPRNIKIRGKHRTHNQYDFVWRIHSAFNARFERMRHRYQEMVTWALSRRALVITLFVVFCALSLCIYPFVGRDFFPQVDAGELRLHLRVPPNTRIEETARIFARVEDEIRTVIPRNEIGMVVDDIGLPPSNNLAYGDNATVGPSDGEILVALSEDHHPTALYMAKLREDLAAKFPEETFFFQPADIVSQILNFGLPAPIDVQVSGPNTNKAGDLAVANELSKKIAAISGTADVHLQQITDAPALRIDVDRNRAQQVGLTEKDVANNILVSLAGTYRANPSYWVDPKNGVVYNIIVQTPQYKIATPEELLSTSLKVPGQAQPELLSNIATLSHDSTALVISHYNIQPVFDVFANTQGRDLGGVSADIDKAVASVQKDLPHGSFITIRGQVEDMNSTFTDLGLGILGALVLVYLLLVINFQNWIDPLVVVAGAPGTFGGIMWMLFITQTTLSVPSLTGTIMTIGVSTANSILVVSFANDLRKEGFDAVRAAIIAGTTRLRPVLMTALAMVVGMIPMALGLGEGGEQNAPLGRAVIGGLFVATIGTLFIVPIAYSLLRRGESPQSTGQPANGRNSAESEIPETAPVTN
ncbi:MAG: efflux RND transporter permease subunit [Capsulimonadaceae bacterium]